MKKKLIIITIFILLLISISLYYTYAIDITIEEVSSSNADLTFNINIEDISSRTISVKAGETKYFDVFITNPSDSTINYGLVYDNVEVDGITIAQVNTSKNEVSELIGGNTTHQISLFIKNITEQDYTYNIMPVVGYKKGGDLIVPSGYTKITEVQEAPVEPNSPDLVDGLIPITYSNNKWVKANANNIDSNWYNYDLKKWANAVLVSSSYRNSDGTDKFNVGDEIPESAILAYYVWIPRYKYRVWNINKTIGVDSYDAYNKGIDIKWEIDKRKTGSIKCNEYDFSITDNSLNEVCNGSNGEYYTHPAFSFGVLELRGLWVGKFELSSSSPTATDGGGTSITLTPRIKPSVLSWRYNPVDNYFKVIEDMQINGNEYGLTTDKTLVDSHMIKNMEWGSIAYLSHSKYGRCNKENCREVSINSYYNDTNFMTGCGPRSETSTNSGSTCYEYNSELGKLASTTGNIYGIYDMSGGAYEYVMGNISSTSGSYTYKVAGAGSNFSYSKATSKYIDTYSFLPSEISRTEQLSYNRARLGDAISEVVETSSYAWYGDLSYFPVGTPWMLRGGISLLSTETGIFNLTRDSGAANKNMTTRAILISIK